MKPYDSEYCACLEAAYGPNMMSEGGDEYIDKLVEGISIEGACILDVGAGLGGTSCRLAQHHGGLVIGLDVDPGIIAEAISRIPVELESKVRFVYSKVEQKYPFPDDTFDVVFCKSALSHVKDKGSLFQEFIRVLKPGGRLVISDFLSGQKGKWPSGIERMAELDGLELFADTEMSYKEYLVNAGFEDVYSENHSTEFAKYNRDIVLRLEQNKDNFIRRFGLQIFEDSKEGYNLIAESFLKQETFIMKFSAKKI